MKSARPQPPVIIMVDDESGVLRAFEIVIRRWFKNVTLLLFENPVEAWQELLRTTPDLLIMRDRMPGLTGQEIAQRLMDRKVTFPIIIGGGWPPTEEWVNEYTNENPNITFLRYPCTTEEIYERLSKYLGASDSPPQFPKATGNYP